MKQVFTKMFLGFLFVLVEINIIALDILPDPLGYFFIYLALEKIWSEYKIRNRSRLIAIILFAFSLPTIFVQQSNADITGAIMSDGWQLYMSALGIGKLILVFYVFQIMMKLAKKFGDEEMLKKTEKTSKVYIIAMLIVSCMQPFLMNLDSDIRTGAGLVLIGVGLIMDIVLLILLFRFRTLETERLDTLEQTTDSNT
ncbi:hypothetical protein [Pseudalkalibacillus salsuginis]|uniref:hypothetical protein n=1 Tax=Pseudalkalibacillus salsuginis TaxID=2910972 RepID=UPI001F254891|nr:hypothetical protein [Pseudalkalibacillus salsuginis]MCF6409948.1 hypothetical protein [Pseudalkalibacillus salsuginis]